jgi:hypothetical protein
MTLVSPAILPSVPNKERGERKKDKSEEDFCKIFSKHLFEYRLSANPK